jgi:hypothetical protein
VETFQAPLKVIALHVATVMACLVVCVVVMAGVFGARIIIRGICR